MELGNFPSWCEQLGDAWVEPTAPFHNLLQYLQFVQQKLEQKTRNYKTDCTVYTLIDKEIYDRNKYYKLTFK